MHKASCEEKPVRLSAILPASPTPIGKLGVFSREIRDEIYRYVLSTTYNGKYSFTSDVLFTLQSDLNGNAQPQWDGAYQHKILRVSTWTRREAMEVLCSEEVFTLETWYYPNNPQVRDISFVDRIMNVSLSNRSSDLWNSVERISLFAGGEVLRKTFVMRIYECGYGGPEIPNPPLVEVVKQLTGFKTVTLELYLYPRRYLLELPKCDSDIWLLFDPDIGFNVLVHALRQGLEPTLGPSTQQSLSVKERTRTRHDVGVTFHPRDYLSGKTQVAKKHSEIQTKEVTHVPSATRD